MRRDWDSEVPEDLYGAARHFERRGEEGDAVEFFERALAMGLAGARRDRCLVELGIRRKRLDDWEGAAALWNQVRDRDSRERLEVLVWLAKREEHRRKNPGKALLHVEDALERLPRVPLSGERAASYRDELRHREARLRRSLA